MPVEVSLDYFDPWVIMDSGQCFRMVPLDDGRAVETVAMGRRVVVTSPKPGRYVFDCDPQTFETFWRGYFDLDTDYRALIDAAPKDDTFLANALAYAQGLRILQQEPWETLCGFILSQRKNIKAIRACMETLSDAYGEPVEGTARKNFPSPERLAGLTEAELRACGLGYRAPYVLDAARKVACGMLNMTSMAALSDLELQNCLMGIHGVGIKVADCAMLFAYRRLTRAPVDVWIHRVIEREYGGVSPFDGYGTYAGVYQQYMFIYERDRAQKGFALKGGQQK